MLTALDQIANRNHLQIMKALIPYLPSDKQKMISLYIKFLELQNVMGFFRQPAPQLKSCASEGDSASPSDMLQDIRNYCDDSEKEMVDQLSNMLSAMELFSMMKDISPEDFASSGGFPFGNAPFGNASFGNAPFGNSEMADLFSALNNETKE